MIFKGQLFALWM